MLPVVHPIPLSERTVSLSFPARPDYVVLARLALSAVCRLVPFGPDEIGDLKLAVTEGAACFVADGSDQRLTFTFVLDDGLVVDIGGPTITRRFGPGDADLSKAIIAATVDESYWLDGRLRLVKRLVPPGSEPGE